MYEFYLAFCLKRKHFCFQLIVKVIRPEGREDGVPGSRTLDVDAIQAAYARQYTKEQILHAVTKYFFMTCECWECEPFLNVRHFNCQLIITLSV